ncbi:hypothetical protein SAY87_013186 [Trapa incisa]|uniref:Uncharacterized protein n=1 Tax=Trapa incisa TaxID=236973 RepID=A0AAN7KFX7_9MYRT|nr:hypothetical protein SAY87_013186 [Trapa incisa]
MNARGGHMLPSRWRIARTTGRGKWHGCVIETLTRSNEFLAYCQQFDAKSGPKESSPLLLLILLAIPFHDAHTSMAEDKYRPREDNPCRASTTAQVEESSVQMIRIFGVNFFKVHPGHGLGLVSNKISSTSCSINGISVSGDCRKGKRSREVELLLAMECNKKHMVIGAI